MRTAHELENPVPKQKCPARIDGMTEQIVESISYFEFINVFISVFWFIWLLLLLNLYLNSSTFILFLIDIIFLNRNCCPNAGSFIPNHVWTSVWFFLYVKLLFMRDMQHLYIPLLFIPLHKHICISIKINKVLVFHKNTHTHTHILTAWVHVFILRDRTLTSTNCCAISGNGKLIALINN